jgi:hypothetical protein
MATTMTMVTMATAALCAAGAACAASTTAGAQTAALSPDDFAFGSPVLVSQPAAAYRVPLSLAVYQHGVRAVIDGIHLSISTNGSAVQWQAHPAPDAAAVAGPQYLLDGRALSVPVSAFVLHWAQSDLGYSGRLRIDASEDLGTWRTVVAMAPVVNLRANGQSIVQDRIELPATQSKFWRLSWLGAAPPMKLD